MQLHFLLCNIKMYWSSKIIKNEDYTYMYIYVTQKHSNSDEIVNKMRREWEAGRNIQVSTSNQLKILDSYWYKKYNLLKTILTFLYIYLSHAIAMQ